MAEAAWNNLMAQIGYSNISRNYLQTAIGVDSPSMLVKATTLLGFYKFIGDLSKRVSSLKLANNQTKANKPSYLMVASQCLKAFWMYLEC